jgi:hypothetical protein
MRALSETQKLLYELRPPNYGLLTGLLCYLMESVGSTARITPTVVLEALRSLNIAAIVNRFGMAFLHDLDVRSMEEALPKVQSADDVLVRTQLRLRDDRVQRQKQSVHFRESIYTQSWGEVIRAVEREPWNIIAPWQFRELAVKEATVGLFRRFTQQLWFMPSEKVIVPAFGRPPTNDLREAMAAWSFAVVYKTTSSAAFSAIHTGHFRAVTGPKQPLFAERARIYFPDPEDMKKLDGKWL